MTTLSIIFDLDGTLLDTLDGLASCCNHVLFQLEMPTHPVSSYRNFVGDGLETLIARSMPHGASPVVIARGCQLFFDTYQESWKTSCTAFTGVIDMLHNCRKRDISLAILSNKPHTFTKLFVEEFLPHEIFTCVYGKRDGFSKKPDPAVALYIAKRLQSPPSQTMFVGDSNVDIATGVNAGMIPVGVSWGFRTVEELKSSGASHIINHPDELLNYV